MNKRQVVVIAKRETSDSPITILNMFDADGQNEREKAFAAANRMATAWADFFKNDLIMVGTMEGSKCDPDLKTATFRPVASSF